MSTTEPCKNALVDYVQSKGHSHDRRTKHADELEYPVRVWKDYIVNYWRPDVKSPEKLNIARACFADSNVHKNVINN